MTVTVLISVDIEGVANVWSKEQTTPGSGDAYEAARRWMTAEAGAAAAGAFDGGADRVLVADAHGQYTNVLPDRCDPRIEFIQGKPRRHGMLAGIDDAIDGALFVGWHAMAGSSGVLAHTTNSLAFARVELDGIPVGEFGLYAALAAERGVPVWMVSGCDVLAAEVTAIAPDVPVTIVKWSHGARSGRALSPAAACQAIRSAATAAVRRGVGAGKHGTEKHGTGRDEAGKDGTKADGTIKDATRRSESDHATRQPPAPPNALARHGRSAQARSLRIRCMTPAHADLFCLWPSLHRVDAVTVSMSCASAHDAVATINALSAMAQSLR